MSVFETRFINLITVMRKGSPRPRRARQCDLSQSGLKKQLDIQALHETRERLLTERTRRFKQGCGFLIERDMRVRTGRRAFQKELVNLVPTGTLDLSHFILSKFSDMMEEPATNNDPIEAIDAEIKMLAKADTDIQRLI